MNHPRGRIQAVLPSSSPVFEERASCTHPYASLPTVNDFATMVPMSPCGRPFEQNANHRPRLPRPGCRTRFANVAADAPLVLPEPMVRPPPQRSVDAPQNRLGRAAPPFISSQLQSKAFWGVG